MEQNFGRERTLPKKFGAWKEVSCNFLFSEAIDSVIFLAHFRIGCFTSTAFFPFTIGKVSNEFWDLTWKYQLGNSRFAGLHWLDFSFQPWFLTSPLSLETRKNEYLQHCTKLFTIKVEFCFWNGIVIIDKILQFKFLEH